MRKSGSGYPGRDGGQWRVHWRQAVPGAPCKHPDPGGMGLIPAQGLDFLVEAR
jgi:hypothetical protein